MFNISKLFNGFTKCSIDQAQSYVIVSITKPALFVLLFLAFYFYIAEAFLLILVIVLVCIDNFLFFILVRNYILLKNLFYFYLIKSTQNGMLI